MKFQIFVCLLLVVAYVNASNKNFSHLKKLLKKPVKGSKKTILSPSTKLAQDDMIVRDEDASVKGKIASCTDAACDANENVDTSEWAVLNKTQSEKQKTKAYISEDTTVIENKSSDDIPKKNTLQDIFSSTDSTTKSEQVAQNIEEESGKVNNEQIKNIKANHVSAIIAEEKIKQADKKLTIGKTNSIESKNETICTDAACMAGPPKKENQTSLQQNEKENEVEESEKEASSGEGKISANEEKSNQTIVGEKESSAKETKGKNIKENESINEGDSEDIESAGNKKSKSIMDKLVESVQYEDASHAKSNCTDALCSASSEESKRKLEDSEGKANTTAKTVEENQGNKTASSTDESVHDEEVTGTNKANEKESECTDASCSVSEKEEPEVKELKKEKEEESIQIKSECTNATCSAAKESEEIKTEKKETAEKTNAKELDNVKEKESECTDAACSVGAKPQADVKTETKESDKALAETEKETDEENDAEMKAITEDIESNDNKTTTTGNSTASDLQKFKQDFSATLENHNETKSVNENVAEDDELNSKSECTDAACSIGEKPTANKTQQISDKEKPKDNKNDTTELQAENEQPFKVNLKKEETETAKFNKEDTNKKRIKSKCEDASCSSYLKQKIAEASKKLKQKNITASLLSTTTKVHPDNTNNSVFDNGTSEFLSEVLPKTEDVEDIDESAQHKPENKVEAKHESDNEKDVKVTCTDAACSDRSTTEEHDEESLITKTPNKKVKTFFAKKSKVHKSDTPVNKIND